MLHALEIPAFIILSLGVFFIIPPLLILGLVLTVREVVFYSNGRKKKMGLIFISLLYLWGIFSYVFFLFAIAEFGKAIFSGVIS